MKRRLAVAALAIPLCMGPAHADPTHPATRKTTRITPVRHGLFICRAFMTISLLLFNWFP